MRRIALVIFALAPCVDAQTAIPQPGELNSFVLEVVERYPADGTHRYFWPKTGRWKGNTKDLEYGGVVIAAGDPEGRCYCCGLTFEVLLEAWRLWCVRTERPFRIGDLDVDGVKRLQGQWFGSAEDHSCLHTALVDNGLGFRVTDWDDARPGDFVQLWRASGSGHSVVFLGWERDGDGRITGIRYWSTQPATEGIGERVESFEETAGGKRVRRDKLWLCRVGAAPRPNVVLIVADDLGWGDVGWHNDEIRTPVLDRLVESGVELDRHYVQPQCTPTRVALMTGRYPSRFADHCTQASNLQAFEIGTLTMARAFETRGYATCLVGKWHLGSKPEWGPQHHGFQHSYGSLAGAVGMYDHRYRLDTEYANTWHRDGELIEDEEGHATDLVTEAAIGWLRENARRPFFLYVPFHSVHVPLVEEPHWLERNEHVDDPDRRLFAAAVTHMDDCVGRIVAALEELGVREETLLVFFSDNGGLRRHGGGAYPPPDPKLETVSSNAPLRGWKTDVFEGGIRVPAFASWPGRLAAGTSRQVMHAVDWLPTLAGLIGFEPEQEPGWDGIDVWGAIAKPGGEPQPRRLYWKWGKKLALRDGDWKIARNRGRGAFMLFELGNDPGEQRDLAEEEPARLEKMLELLRGELGRDAVPMGLR